GYDGVRAAGVEDVGDPAGDALDFGLAQAARRDGRRAEPEAPVALRRFVAGVAGQRDAVDGDVSGVQRAFRAHRIDLRVAQVDEQHVVVGAARHDLEAARDQSVR